MKVIASYHRAKRVRIRRDAIVELKVTNRYNRGVSNLEKLALGDRSMPRVSG
jgi:hypothetical protein